MAKDGVVSIAIDYKNELNQMIRDYESALTEMASSDKLSKGMKTQFNNTIAELKHFKADMEKSFSDLSIGKVDKNSFKSFKETVNKNFESVRAEIDRLDLAVSTINSQIKILGNDVDISKISNQFKDFQDYVQDINNAIDAMIKKLDGQGISLMSFSDSAVNQAKSQIKKINKLLKSTDELSDAKGSKYELFNTDQAQAELDVLARDLKNTLELIEKSESKLSNFNKNSVGFEKTINQINILKLKAADLHDSIQQLIDIPDKAGEYTFGDLILISDDNVDKKVSEYEKIVKGSLNEIRESAIKTREELEKIVRPTSSKTASAKISDKLNPNSAELVTGVTIETTSSELWKKLSPILDDLQKDLNSNPVVAPVKLVVAPTAVSSEKTGEVGGVSKNYSKKYQKILAETGKDAVIDLEGAYKKTFTSIMDEAVSYAKETIERIQKIFENTPIDVKFNMSQEELDKIQNFVLSNNDGKAINISGQVTKTKKEVEELAESLEKVKEVLSSTDGKKVSFEGFDKFTEEIKESLAQLTEFKDMIQTLQSMESILSKATGISGTTELTTQWETVSKLITNAVKLDGNFRKNANIGKLASEYNKYLNMGGTNEISSIDKIVKLENSENVISTILSKVKELNSQNINTESVDIADNELKSVSSTLDDVISRLDHMINLTRDIGNTFWKMFKDASVNDVDKQWSSIESKFKSIADESGKINLSKQKKDIQELVEMYQKYTNAGGIKTPFDLTDNTETIKKLNKVYEQMNSKKDGSSVASESKNFTKVEDSVNSLTSTINTKTEAIKTEANTMELAARAEVKSIQKIIDALNPLIEKIENIPELRISNDDFDLPSVSNNIKSQIKDVELLQELGTKAESTSDKISNIFVHFGTDFDNSKFEKIKNRIDGLNKPGKGFWGSYLDSEYGWEQLFEDPKKYLTSTYFESNDSKEWFASNKPNKLLQSFYKLKEDAHVLVLETVEDLQQLPSKGLDSAGKALIDWEKIAEQYDAISVKISNSTTEFRQAMYGWDADSLVVTNPNAIIQVDAPDYKAKEIEIAKQIDLYKQLKKEASMPIAIQLEDISLYNSYKNIVKSTEKELKLGTIDANTALEKQQEILKGTVFYNDKWNKLNPTKDAFQPENESGNAHEIKENLDEVVQDFQEASNSSEKFSGNVENDFNEIISIIKSANQGMDDYVEKWKILKQKGRVGDNAFSAKFQKNDGQIEDWYFQKNTSGNGYNIVARNLTTNYDQFEKIIIAAESKLRDLEAQKESIIAQTPTASTDGLDKQIAYQKAYVDLLDQTAQYLRQNNETILKGAQIENARNQAAQEYYLKKGVKDDIANAKQLSAEEKKRKANIEQTNRLLNKQQIIIDGIEKKYNKTVNPDLTKSVNSRTDITELTNKKAEIQKLINQLTNQGRNDSNEDDYLKLERLVAEYKQLTSDKLKSNNPSQQEMGAKELSVSLEKLVSQYNSLIAKSESYGEATAKLTERLKAERDVIAKFDTDKGVYTARNDLKADQYISARDQYQKSSYEFGSKKSTLKNNSVKEQQQVVNQALKDQISAWKQIQSIREKIAKEDVPDNIKQLQKTKEYYQEQYIAAQKIVKANQDICDYQAQVNKLSQIELETTIKINSYKNNNFKQQKENLINQFKPYTDKTKYTSDFIIRAKSYIDKTSKLDFIDPQDVTRLKDIEDELQKVVNDSKLLENRLVKQKSKLEDIISQMKIYRTQNTNMSSAQKASLKDIIDTASEMGESGEITAQKVEDIKVAFSRLKAKVTEAGNTGKNFFSQISNRLSDMNSKFVAQFLSWQDWIRYFRQGIETVREFDSALAEMRKVSDESVQSLKKIQEASFDVADALGVTSIQLQNSIADFMRVGDTTEEAQKHAIDANTLLQVSEFESIDEATSALVSMNQAWNDVDTGHINDVLNILGNNMPIATNELASSLQRSAGTLATLGATIEEASALTVAGNAILQDPDSVAAGLRTIDLRMVGTSEAKEELQQIGEDTDDFVVQTESKLRESIMNLTKVASNGYKGFDILDENGNYKSFYERMLGLSEIYEELQEQDKKLGQNSATALIELIAGKNRSAIAGAILSSPDVLKEAYDLAMNADGSAAEELEKSLDTIDAKMAQLSNRADEFWITLINSDTIKNGIDLLSTFLKSLNSLVDALDAIPLLMGGVGAVLSANGTGLLKTITDIDGKTSVRFGDEFKSLFNGDFFSPQSFSLSEVLSSDDLEVVKKYNTEFDRLKDIVSNSTTNVSDATIAQKAYSNTLTNASDKVKTLQANANGGKIALDNMTKSSKASELALKGLAIAGNIVASIAISWAINQTIKAIDDLAHAAENARQESQELTSAYTTEKETLDNSIKQYKELGKQLDNQSLSTSEVKSIKEQLLTIQDQLNEKYGAEATQIDLVNGKYDEQIEKLGILSKKKANDYLAENGSGIQADRKYLSEKFNVNQSLGFKGSQANPDDYSNVGFDLKKYLDKYDKLDAKVVNPDGQYGLTGDVNLITDGTRQEVYDQLSALYAELSRDFGNSNPAVTAFQTTLSNILTSSFDSTEISAAKERVKTYAETEILANDNASESYNNLIDAVDNYNKALASGEGVEEAESKLLDAKNAAEDATSGITNAGDVLQDLYKFDDSAPIKIRLEFANNTEEDLEQEYNDLLDKIIPSRTNSTSGITAITSNKLGQTNSDVATDWVNTLTEEEVKLANSKEFDKALEEQKKKLDGATLSADNYATALQTVKDAQNGNSNETPISFEKAWSDLTDFSDDSESQYKDIAEELEKLADAGQLTAESLREVENAEEYFEGIGFSAQEAAEKVNALADESTQIASMADQISKMSDALATKKENGSVDYSALSGFSDEIKDLDAWDTFQNALGSATSTMEECQEAADALATEWVNNSNFLVNLNKENKDYYVTQLKTMGVENAEKIVTSVLAQKKRELALEQKYLNILKANGIDVTHGLASVTSEEISKLLEEGSVSQDTASKLAELVIKKQLANGTTLSTAADIRNLADLAGAATKLGALLTKLADVKQGFTNGMPSSVAQQQAENLQKQIEALVGGGNAVEVDTKVKISDVGSKSNSSNSGSSGGSGSDSKEEINWIERKLSVIQTAIDLTKAKFENLFKVKSKSNNLQKQLTLTKDLLEASTKAAKKYREEANKVNLSKALKKKVQNGDYDISEYSSKVADAINDYQEKYDNFKSMQQQVQELKQSLRELKQEKNQLYIDRADSQREKSEAIQANMRVNNANNLNKAIEYQKKQIKESYKYQIRNAKLEKDSVEVARLKAERQKELRELTLQEFENIQNAYDYRLKANEATKDAIADALNLAETKGEVIGKAYYTGQIATTQKDLDSRQKELVALENKQKSIKKYTEEWYSAQEIIDDVKSAIRQDEIEIAEFQNSINELKWDRFDELINKISDISTELDFLKNTLSDTLFDDNGMITDDGLTAMGLTLMNGNTAMSMRDYYKNQLEQLESDYARGEIGYDNYIAKQREYTQSLQDSVSSIVEAKKATVDYVKQGLDAQNEALGEAIEKKKELLEEEKELKEWNEKLIESNKNIARMERRLAIISQDTSEENQKAIRELKSQLEDAKKEQEDDFYEKSISDQEDALDKTLENAQIQAEEYLKNTKQVFSDALTYINANSQVIASNISKISKDLGYDVSTYITSAWNDGSSAITNYSATLTDNVTGITSQISLIASSWDEVCASADRAAQSMINALNSNNKSITTTTKTTVTTTASNAKLALVSILGSLTSSKNSQKTTSSTKTSNASISWGTKKIGKNSAYATGGIVEDIIKSTGEDGIAFLRRGEAVLTQEQTKALLNFKTVLPQVDSLMNVLKDIPRDTSANLGQSVSIINNTTVEGVATDKIVKDFENVAAKQAENVVRKINNATYTKGVRR